MTIAFLTTPTIHQLMVDNEDIDFYDILNLSSVTKFARQAFNNYYNWKNLQFKCLVLKECSRLEIGRRDQYKSLSESEKKYVQIGLASRVFERSKKDFQRNLCPNVMHRRNLELAICTSFGPTKSAFKTALKMVDTQQSIWKYAFLIGARLPDNLDDLKTALSLFHKDETNGYQRREAFLAIARKLISINTSESLELLDSITQKVDKLTSIAIDCAFAHLEEKNIVPLLQNKAECDSDFYRELVAWRISCADSKAFDESLEIASFVDGARSYLYAVESIMISKHMERYENKLRIASAICTKVPNTDLLQNLELFDKPQDCCQFIQLETTLSSMLKDPSPETKKSILKIIDQLSHRKRYFFNFILNKYFKNIDKVTTYDLKLLSLDPYGPHRLPKLLEIVDKNPSTIDVPEGSSFAATVHSLLNNFSRNLTNEDVYEVLARNYRHSLGVL